MTALLEVTDLKKHFPIPSGFLRAPRTVRAVDGVSFAIDRGETLSIVGESGCGKSTVGRAILRLVSPTAGEIRLNGTRIDNLPIAAVRPQRRQLQVVFQDPFSSLSPRLRVRDIIAEPIVNFGLARTRAEIDERVAAMLAQVRLPAEAARRFPHEFSGGQRQRIAIARALASGPELIICDEAVSALDVSVKAQIVNLFAELRETLGLALMFISHDLAVVEHLTDRVAVMYLGRIVEIADRKAVFGRPHHPYTRALLSAISVPDPTARRDRMILEGDLPSPIDPPPGCPFHTRCPFAFARCRIEAPVLRPVGGAAHLSACHLDDDGRTPQAAAAA